MCLELIETFMQLQLRVYGRADLDGTHRAIVETDRILPAPLAGSFWRLGVQSGAVRRPEGNSREYGTPAMHALWRSSGRRNLLLL
jgi:hypothetical protein